MKEKYIRITLGVVLLLATGALFYVASILSEESQVDIDSAISTDNPDCVFGEMISVYGYCGKVIGHSVEKRPIHVFKIGEGERKLLFIGGLHTGREINTVYLAEQMLDYYGTSTTRIPDTVSVYIIPVLNPDGVANGTHTNARDVNLNRNWGTDNWKADVYHPVSGTVAGGGGVEAYSEPEVKALHDYILELQPDLAVVWHSKAGTVEDSDVGNADALGAVYAEATGYTQIDEWTAYEVTGDFVTDMSEEDIPAMEVELETRETEFDRNVRAVEALFDYFARPQS